MASSDCTIVFVLQELFTFMGLVLVFYVISDKIYMYS